MNNFRFNTRSLLAITLIIGLAIGVLLQRKRLSDVQAARQRLQWTTSSAELPAGHFRLSVAKIVDSAGLDVIQVRVWAQDSRMVQIDDGGPGHIAARTNSTAGSHLHWVDITLVIDESNLTPQRVESAVVNLDGTEMSWLASGPIISVMARSERVLKRKLFI